MLQAVVGRVGVRSAVMVLVISQKALTQRLRDLERDGMVERRVYASIPPRVEYTLTPMGESLITVANTVRLWAFDHIRQIEVA